jgi:hypothetical protein
LPSRRILSPARARFTRARYQVPRLSRAENNARTTASTISRPGAAAFPCGKQRRAYIRTCGSRDGLLRVRFCTRSSRACAKSDNGVANLARTCPLMHTGPVRVCENGRVKVRQAPHVSVFAHGLFALPWVVDSPPPHLNGFIGGCERGAEFLALGKAKSGNKQDERNSQATQTLSESTGKQEPASPEVVAASSQLPRGNPGRSFFFLWVCRRRCYA